MRYHIVKVCKGPNCKAWSSDQIARDLRNIRNTLDLPCIKVCRVSCMDACHGGISVHVDSKGKVLKLKDVEELLIALGINEDVLV